MGALSKASVFAATLVAMAIGAQAQELTDREISAIAECEEAKTRPQMFEVGVDLNCTEVVLRSRREQKEVIVKNETLEVRTVESKQEVSK